MVKTEARRIVDKTWGDAEKHVTSQWSSVNTDLQGAVSFAEERVFVLFRFEDSTFLFLLAIIMAAPRQTQTMNRQPAAHTGLALPTTNQTPSRQPAQSYATQTQTYANPRSAAGSGSNTPIQQWSTQQGENMHLSIAI